MIHLKLLVLQGYWNGKRILHFVSWSKCLKMIAIFFLKQEINNRQCIPLPKAASRKPNDIRVLSFVQVTRAPRLAWAGSTICMYSAPLDVVA